MVYSPKDLLDDIFLTNQETDESLNFNVCGSYKDLSEVSNWREYRGEFRVLPFEGTWLLTKPSKNGGN